MGIEKGHRPTAKEMRKGPVVKLVSERWASRSWSPHGFAYNITFNDKGEATVLKAHWDKWIDESVAAYAGIRLVESKKKPTKKEGANA